MLLLRNQYIIMIKNKKINERVKKENSIEVKN
ncbi:hypothetical protein EV214_1086 [Marinisporobacter balticus]|uniref:Uncharacterized protein n=1 Tax=Marinisporobacter balticus TaxID=2018667 RepID=A0A4R2LAV5_9FIRM|nr:hypothetical protein EV214_1086 [Marinisporobacter balticus]